MKTFAKTALLATAFAGAVLTGCTPAPPAPPPPAPSHNEYNITMNCLGHLPQHFDGVSLSQGITLYHVQKYEVVNTNKLRLVFEKNFRKLGCTMEREAVESKAAPAAPASPKL